jgi:beta-galactosidase
LQPENEYSTTLIEPSYMADVEDFYRDSGIVVPFINNDGLNYGNFAPGTGLGAVDIYGHDSYPLGYTCANPYVWQGLANQYFPTDWYTVHMEQSPSTPYAIAEMEGGTLDGWGGVGFNMCNEMLNEEFERVFYKNDFSFGVKIINYYMLYGGTNWGNLGYPGGYTSCKSLSKCSWAGTDSIQTTMDQPSRKTAL